MPGPRTRGVEGRGGAVERIMRYALEADKRARESGVMGFEFSNDRPLETKRRVKTNELELKSIFTITPGKNPLDTGNNIKINAGPFGEMGGHPRPRLNHSGVNSSGDPVHLSAGDSPSKRPAGRRFRGNDNLLQLLRSFAMTALERITEGLAYLLAPQLAGISSIVPPFHSYPTRWALPGCMASEPEAKPLTGATAGIVHALTYYGIPPAIDDRIEALPGEGSLQGLTQVQKDLLSFTVYSLKQMTAAAYLSPETAWALFDWQWQRITEVNEDGFQAMRQAFWQKADKGLDPNDPLRAEFLARAGQAGSAQFERYQEWAEQLVFKGDLPEHLKDEYRKALWLEMRLIEHQIGLSGMNAEVHTFTVEGDPGYGSGKLTGRVDLFGQNFSEFPDVGVVDAVLKAEIGHWFFEALCDVVYNGSIELMDRMNMAGYTEEVNRAFDLPVDRLSPMQRAFLSGGYFLMSYDQDFPSYPGGWQCETPEGSDYEHIIAEYMEWLIRKKVIEAVRSVDIAPGQAYETYRRMGVYVAVLNLQRLDYKEILERIEALDLDEIARAVEGFRSVVAGILMERHNDPEEDLTVRLAAVKALAFIGDRSVLPILQANLSSMDRSIRSAVAQGMIRIKRPDKGSDEYNKLFANVLLNREQWDELAALGSLASAALQAALRDREPSIREKAAQMLGEIRDPLSVPALTMALYDMNDNVKLKVIEALVKIGDLKCMNALSGLLMNSMTALDVRVAVVSAMEKLRR